ncbi:LysM peptidoglycan-binding domain-containing protein, partial [Psychromonas sp. RZ22]|uniref:LysM peptidoglycan-binding domain-containing protein n=1 Tax=Psychromonas algarum TaxID=2555643 RepID=UPI001067D78F
SVIAQKYNKTSAQLKSFNKLRSTSLAIGQKIKIPGGYVITKTTVTPKVVESHNTQPSVHVVQRGESLSVIAHKYNKTSAQLKSFNKLRSTSLAIGQKIKIPGSISTVSSSPIVEQKEQVHKVRRGESLSVIASNYGYTSSQLKRYNKLRSTSLRVGQKIKIPASTAALETVKIEVPTQHIVKSGEALSLIAQRYGRTSEQFKSYNNLRSSQLAIGQVLKIPNEDYVAPSRPASHTVTSGQSLSVIAHKYGITTQQLKTYNNLRSSSLAVGQKLKIPPQKPQVTKHKVRSGESLSVIAQRYGTTTSAIISTNNLRSKSLAIGQVLTIPMS